MSRFIRPLARLLSLFGWVALLSATPALAQDSGNDDLEKATDLKLTATTLRDLDEIADLCESAIEKGLDEESQAFAKQLWASTLYEHAKLLSDRIFAAEPDRRWRLYRRQAVTRLEGALEIDPQLADAHILIARLNMELPDGNQETARASIDKIIELAGDDQVKLGEAYLLRARVAEEDEEILANLNKAVEADPNNVRALQVRGALHLKNEEFELALADFKKVGELEANETTGYTVVAQTYLEMEEFDKALEYADKVIEIVPESSEGYLLKARIYRDQEKIDEAIAETDIALEKDPDDLEAYLFRAGIFYEREQYDQAMGEIQETLRIAPRNIRGIYMRSFVHLAKEEHDKAIADMRLLVQNAQFVYQNNPDALDQLLQYTNDLAMLYTAAERSKRAIEIYDGVLQQDAENTRALRGRGDAFLNIGDHEQAIADYKAAMNVDPDDDGILNNYAWVLATSPDEEIRDGKLAIELATKACELTDYGEAHILSTLASGYAEIGDFETAKKWAAEAVEKAGDDEQRENLSKELESYQRGEPWRERQSEEDNGPDNGGGDFSQDDDPAKDDGKKDDGKKDDGKKDDGKQDDGKQDDGNQDDGAQQDDGAGGDCAVDAV